MQRVLMFQILPRKKMVLYELFQTDSDRFWRTKRSARHLVSTALVEYYSCTIVVVPLMELLVCVRVQYPVIQWNYSCSTVLVQLYSTGTTTRYSSVPVLLLYM